MRRLLELATAKENPFERNEFNGAFFAVPLLYSENVTEMNQFFLLSMFDLLGIRY